ncbi:hypothetical protein ACIBTV_27685 [Micromonospora sp. NPDC049366]|uniref:hypothetical protein n=1 Tax=Micromonospora sp. NPDC049366 TaxID=3364271 RepID=UPI00378766DD
MTETAPPPLTVARADPPRITQPQFPGATRVVEYEINVSYVAHRQLLSPGHAIGEAGEFSTALPGTDGVEAALRVFHALASTERDGGTLNLIAWSGADRERAVGLILAQHTWDRD